MKILGIESSCDDTSATLLECTKQGCFVLNEKTASQIDIHKKYGGVVPEIAGRMHAEKIIPLIEEVLDKNKPDVIAVASGPGLITGLIIGVEAARTLAAAWDIPLVKINHIEGHIHSVELNNNKIQYPALALIASGGHTEIIHIKKQGEYKMIGATRDDAAGECFDKVAKLCNLPYPGGPQISKLAADGNEKAIDFPRPMINNNDYDFSFSGLKTSAMYWLNDNKENFNINDFCASFEQAIVDTLVKKTLRATNEYNPKTIILSGGVSANKKLRTSLTTSLKKQYPKVQLLLPDTNYAMDNASMIAMAGYYKALKKDYTNWQDIQANPNWELGR